MNEQRYYPFDITKPSPEERMVRRLKGCSDLQAEVTLAKAQLKQNYIAENLNKWQQEIPRIYPDGIEVNTHEKLIQSMVEGRLTFERLTEILQQSGYTGDTFSYGDILKVIKATGVFIYTDDDPELMLTEGEYFQMVAGELNNL